MDGSTNDGTLQNGFYFPDSVNVTLSSSLTAGTYWIGVIADANGQVTESNENDNTSSPVQITVTSPPQQRPNLVANTVSLGSATVQVVNGVAEATFTVAFFGRGSFTFSAQYLGSSQFQGGTSNAVTVNVF